MPAANPYVIYIELFKSDGVTRPNQNEIARVKAFDVNGTTVTDEGQSGFNPSTGGWLPVFMQNIAAFSPPRDQPNLKFEVWNTAEQLVYTTSVFNAIPSGSTVKIVIGVSATIIPGGWTVTGHVRQASGTPVSSGTAMAFDVTNGSSVQVGVAALATDGSYSISFAASSFNNNGVPHAQPNLQVRAVDSAGQPLAQSPIIVAAATNQVVDLTVATTPDTGQNRVFGTITNGLGLPVAGVLVQAFNVTWTTAGIQETALASAVTSGGQGGYEIFYQEPTVAGSPTSCSPPAGQINLIVRASIQDNATPPNITQLGASDIVVNASRDQEVNLAVTRVAVSTSSEYTRLDAAVGPCLGATDAAKFATLNQLNTRPDLLTFIAQTTEQDEGFVQAYVRAWLIAGEINSKVGSPPLAHPMSPEPIYGLVRAGLGTSLADLISVQPDQFFDAMVTSIHGGIISASIEATLRPNPPVNDSLTDDWRTVLAKMMTRTPQSGEQVPFQQPLLTLVFPDTPVTPQVVAPTPTPVLFGTDVTAHSVTMPSPLTAGDLLIVLITNDGSATVTTPSGWTQLWSTSAGSTTPVRFSGYAKVAVAGDAGAAVNFVTSAVETAAVQVYRIAKSSWSGITSSINEGVGVGTPATGSTTGINPPSLAPSWGSATDLWIACAGHDAAISQSGGAPTNYTGNTRTSSGGTNPCTTLSAIRGFAAASEDPGNFTLTTADDWVAQTIAIKPGIASGVPKRELVAGASFDNEGAFSDMVASLVAAGSLTATEGENLTFVFEMYDKVGRYYPIVAAVYPDKALRGWKTIADLATVPLTDTVIGGVPQQGWVTYALLSQSFNAGQLPGDVPGRTTAEKARVYGTRLFDLFGASSAQSRFASTLQATIPSNPSLQPIATFMTANPAFTLTNSNIDQYLIDNPTVTLPAATVTQLKQIQRVYRITQDFTAGAALIANGFDSAVKIAQVEEGQFIASQEISVGGLAAAQNIHRIASLYASEVMTTLVKFNPNVNAVGGIMAIPGKVNLNALSVTQPTEGYTAGLGQSTDAPDPRKLPNWATLFGHLTGCTCGCCQTVLSPGAYLVDLLQFVGSAPKKTLTDRRGDLADLEINCTNTNTVVPYIDLVNEVLEAVASPVPFSLANAGVNVTAATLDAAAGGNGPAVTQVVQALNANAFLSGAATTVKLDTPTNTASYRAWIVSDGVWSFAVRGVAAPFTARPLPPLPLAFQLTTLGGATPVPLVAATLDAAATPANQAALDAAMTQIRGAFQARGYVLGPRAVVRMSAADHPTAPIKREWVIEDDAWRYPVRDPGATNTMFTVYPAPQTSATNDTLEVFPEHVNAGAYQNLQAAVFPFNLPLALGKEEANIFLKAKNVRPHELPEAFTRETREQTLIDGTAALPYLNMSSGEAAAIIAAAPDPGLASWGFETESAVTIPRPDEPTENFTGTWLELLSLVPVFLHRSGLTYQELLELLDTQFVQVDVIAPHSMHVAATADSLAECDFNEFQIAHLNHPTAGKPTLRRISFFIRLWRRLGWTMRDVDRYLMSVEGGGIPGDFKQLFRVKRLIDELRLPPRAVFAFWSSLDVRRTVRNPRSLFDETFLLGTPNQPELADLEKIATGGTVTLPTTTPGEDLKVHVRAALRLKADEIDLLWPAASATLDLALLSKIHRTATFAHALGLSVRELQDLIALTGKDPFGVDGVLGTYRAWWEITRARSTRMTAAAMTYYLTDTSKPGDPAVPAPADLDSFAQRLSTAVGEIASALPAQDHPDAAALSALLAKVVPADKVGQAIEILGETPPSAQDKSFLARYFAPFLPSGAALPGGYIDQIFVPTDVADRYAKVFKTLNDYLIDQAQANAVFQVASELFGVDRDAADLLLSRGLSGVGTGHTTGMADWKTFVGGGWDKGGGVSEPTIENAAPGTHRAVAVIPKAGRYQFVVKVAAASFTSTNNISLSVDDLKATSIDDQVAFPPKHPTVIPSADATVTLLGFDTVARKGGAVLNVRFDSAAGTPAVTLMWKIDNDDPAVVPATATLPFTILVPGKTPDPQSPSPTPPPVLPTAYLKLFKASRVVKGLALTKPELRHIVEHQPPAPIPATKLDLVFSFDRLRVLAAQAPVAWADLAIVIDLLALNRSVAFKTGTLFEFWRDAAAPTVDDIETQTGWKRADVTDVETVWTNPPPPKTPAAVPDIKDPALWYVLQATMSIVDRLDIRAKQILDLLVRNEPTTQAAITLRNAFRSQFSPETWKDVFKPLRDPLRQRQRDALVGYLTTRPVWVGGTARTFIDADDLYAFFLIDVQMEPDTLISRMVLATNVIQLFVERVFLGLEDHDALLELEKAKDQWQWMHKFRVWEANRKVFLYPENYIEPELRDDKTDLFRQLEDEMLQDHITDDKGMIALGNYLEGMNEVSNLEIVGSYIEGGTSDDGNFRLHVVARTRSQPRTFYYRTFEGRPTIDGVWTPWRKVGVDIDADVVAPVVFNGHVHLFWPSIRLKQVQQPTGEKIDGENVGEQRTTQQADIKLMWTEYVPQQDKWLKPRRSKSKATDLQPAASISDSGEERPRTDAYHLRVTASGPEYVSIDLIKAALAAPPRVTTTDGDTTSISSALLSGFTLKVDLLGTFQIWFTGEDTLDTTKKSLVLGANWPAGTLINHNTAVEPSGFSVNGELAKDELRFKGNVPFFERTPGNFRVFATNFGYLDPAQNFPFFYETDTKSMFALNSGIVSKPGLSSNKNLTASFQTFNQPLVRELQRILQVFGPSGLMNRLTEALPIADSRYYSNYYYNYNGSLYLGYHIAGDKQAFGTTQRMFESEYHPRSETVLTPFALPTIEFAYGSSFGVYNWELFFHLPMLIAERLTQDLQFEAALKWYHYVFDPRQGLNTYEQTKAWVDDLPDGSRFWTFLPFFANKDTTASLLDTLGLKRTLSDYERAQLNAAIDDWRRNPFKPHLVARQRLAAYQKFVFMKYLDNLIAWADTLFRQDSFESINQATQLYVIAGELLGQRPQDVESLAVPRRFTYAEIQVQKLDAFSNAVTDVEYQIVGNRDFPSDQTPPPPPSSGMASIVSLAARSAIFQIPRNERLDLFWDAVQDRLFKIRNSMNIDGVKRTLSLFEPPINPALLVAAAAAGLDIGSVVTQLNTPLPHYRFSVWMQKSIDLANELKSFGAEFLAALEKKDGEDLQLLRQGHEIRMLDLVRKVKQNQVAEAEGSIRSLELQRVMAEDRHDEYASRQRISGDEQLQSDKTTTAKNYEALQGALHSLSALLSFTPDGDIGMVGPFPLGKSNFKIGSALVNTANAGAAGLGALASLARGEASLAGIRSGLDRRWEDWKLQERLAAEEMNQIDQQIAVAQIRLAIAEQELDNHDTQIDQAKEVQEFLKSKFTSRDLYSFMVSELSKTFQLVYKLAFDTAKTAERTFQFELGVTDSYIKFGYQDSLHQGLLAGEKLVYDLKRMDVGYLERNKREFEIGKPISLAGLDGKALQDLREGGKCTFELPEIIYDLDFPGQYFRRIKTVRLTIPCVTGPHTSVSAKLTLLGSAFRKVATVDDPSEYPYAGTDDARFVQNPIGSQAIATGSAQNDAGLFELNFRDERYLPFEGAGAISRWQLELPTAARQFDYETISDVVVHVSYTARDGGDALKAAAENDIAGKLNAILTAFSDPEAAAGGLVRAFSLRKEFPDVLHRLLTGTGPVNMTLVPEHFPFLFRDKRMPITVAASTNAHVILKPGQTPTNPTLTVNGQAVTFTTSQVPNVKPGTVATGLGELFPTWTSKNVPLAQTNLGVDQVEDIVLVVTYTV